MRPFFPDFQIIFTRCTAKSQEKGGSNSIYLISMAIESSRLLGSTDKNSQAEKCEEESCAMQSPSWSSTIVASGIMGVLFGAAFYKSHVYEPHMIRGQFLFQRFVMLKVFFSAMGTGALLLAAMSAAGLPQFESARELWRPTATTRGWVTGPALGGFLLGVGMAVSGACPGMVMAAWGADTPDSIWTIVGGLLGAFLFGWNAGSIQQSLLNKGPKGPTSKVYADEEIGIKYHTLAFGLGCFCLLGCVALETLVPWKSEVPMRFEEAMNGPACAFGTASFNFWDCPAWPPSLAGCLVGALQLGTVFVLQTLLGSATAFQVCASCWMLPLPNKFRSQHPYLNAFASPNPKAWWQVFYAGLAVVIAYYCAQTSGDLGKAAGVGPLAAFVGGFLIIFASRLGGGCTSGHGLSGCAILLVQSWIAVPTMFAGGIAVAVMWQMFFGGFFLPELI